MTVWKTIARLEDHSCWSGFLLECNFVHASSGSDTVPRYGLKVVISLSQSEITAKQGQIKSWTTRKEKEDPSTQTKDVSARKTEAKRATFTYFVSRAEMIVIFPFALPNIVALTCFAS